MLIQILIPTIIERKNQFKKLLDELERQSDERVQVLVYTDNREATIGAKRNALLERSTAKYVCFLDCDDWVAPDYISKLIQAAESGCDCASLNGLMTTAGNDPKTFIHSIKYNSYFEKDGTYYRPPNHLNLIKKQKIRYKKFENKSFGEDTDWAMELVQSGTLKTEFEIEGVIYYYKYEPRK